MHQPARTRIYSGRSIEGGDSLSLGEFWCFETSGSASRSSSTSASTSKALDTAPKRGVPKTRATFENPHNKDDIAYWGPYWGSLILGNCHSYVSWTGSGPWIPPADLERFGEANEGNCCASDLCASSLASVHCASSLFQSCPGGIMYHLYAMCVHHDLRHIWLLLS